eukprot:scaffold212637_cov22-Tisochrysis_lutea.AAC.1
MLVPPVVVSHAVINEFVKTLHLSCSYLELVLEGMCADEAGVHYNERLREIPVTGRVGCTEPLRQLMQCTAIWEGAESSFFLGFIVDALKRLRAFKECPRLARDEMLNSEEK